MTMDETRYGLRRRPFPATADPACYYPADGSRTRSGPASPAASRTAKAWCCSPANPASARRCCACACWNGSAAETATAFLTNSHFRDRAGLLQAILYDLSLPYEGRGEQEMRLALTDHLLKHFAAEQKPVVLIVDEAQHLDADLLEELRLLANLEAPGGRALQVVLAAQPSIAETLRRPELAALRQRLAVRAELGALALEEAADYLLHHLRTAGARPEEVFGDEAVELLARGAGGVPRLLNQAGHKALTLAAEADAESVDVEAVLEALAALGLEVELPAGRGRHGRR